MSREPVVHRRPLGAARRLHRPRGVVALVDHPQRLHRARAAVLGVGLVGLKPVDVEPGDVDVGAAVDDPVRHHASEASAREDADGVQPGGHEVVLELRRFAHHRLEIRREALGPAEELADADLHRDRDPLHGGLHVRTHAVPVRIQLTEREVLRHAVHLPRRAHRLEETDHETADLLAEVAERARVLQYGDGARELGDLLRDEVVVLGRLQRDVHAGLRAELPGPHARAVDDVLGLDVAVLSPHTRHDAALLQDARDRHALDDLRPLHSGALGQRHRDVDGVGLPVFLHVEARQDVVGPGQRKELLDLRGRDLVHVDAAVAVERRDAAVLLQAIRLGRDLDEAHRLEPGR